MKYSRRDISPHKLMAMGKPIKAAKGGAISMGKAPMRSIPVANAFPMRKAKGGMARYAKGGGVRTRKFAAGGLSAEQEEWLGGADRTDPHIMSRMRSAVPNRAPVEERKPAPVDRSNGAGAGARGGAGGQGYPEYRYPDDPPAAAPTKSQSFNSAFREARAAGKATFPWKGEQWNTKLEKPKEAGVDAWIELLRPRTRLTYDEAVKLRKEFDYEKLPDRGGVNQDWQGGNGEARNPGFSMARGGMPRKNGKPAFMRGMSRGGSVKSKPTAPKTKGGAVKKAEHKRHGGMTRRSWSNG